VSWYFLVDLNSLAAVRFSHLAARSATWRASHACVPATAATVLDQFGYDRMAWRLQGMVEAQASAKDQAIGEALHWRLP
jgi:hypothetical protein